MQVNEIYLSRLILNPRSREVRRDVSDCHALHCRILESFPLTNEADAAKARESFGVLYRLDVDEHRGRAALLVQSLIRPDWSRLPRSYCLELMNELNPAYKEVSESFMTIRNGMRLRFRLRANPTRKIETKTGADGVRRNGKRVELRDEAEQLAWFERKSALHGFRLQAVRAINENKSKGFRAKHEKTDSTLNDKSSDKQPRVARLTLASVLFEGELIVTDEVLFRESLAKGIGTGKAYGFGLLSVAPARAESE